MLTIEELLEREQIKSLKYTYMRALDTHDWALMATLYTTDANCWFCSGVYSFEGRDAIIDFYRTLLNDNYISSHTAHHPEITLTGPDTAEGIWRLEDHVHFLKANDAAQETTIEGGEELFGAGHYFDNYVKTAEGWKIKTSGYVRLFEQVEKRGQRELLLTVDPARGMRD